MENSALQSLINKFFVVPKENVTKTITLICGPISLILLAIIKKKYSLKELFITASGQIGMIKLINYIEKIN